jgi:hypothetical protein
MAFALACGGAETTGVSEGTEAVPTEAQAPATEAMPGGVSAQTLPGSGCGAFKQTCCQNQVCNTGLECDPATLKCLY